MDDLTIKHPNVSNEKENEDKKDNTKKRMPLVLKAFKVGGYVAYHISEKETLLGKIRSIGEEKIEILCWKKVNKTLSVEIKWVSPSELSHQTFADACKVLLI